MQVNLDVVIEWEQYRVRLAIPTHYTDEIPPEQRHRVRGVTVYNGMNVALFQAWAAGKILLSAPPVVE